MAKETRPGMLVVSIDLAHRSANGAAGGNVERAARAILDLLASFAIPATWAADEFAAETLLARIAAASPEQELAVLADAHWARPEAGRGAYARGLSSRLLRARAQGYRVTTLALAQGSAVEHTDLTVKQGITAVRTIAKLQAKRPGWARWLGGRGEASADGARPRAVRYGLWEFAAAERFAPERAWLGVAAALQTRRELDRAIAARAWYQLVIDVEEFAAAGTRAEKAFARVAFHTDRQRRAGRLELANIRGAVARLSPARGSTPARSILRPVSA